MRKLVWVVCGVCLLILVAAVPAALWLRSKGVGGRWTGTAAKRTASRERGPRELPKPTWKSGPEALAAVGLPDPSRATLGLAATDAEGVRVGVRSIMPWLVGEPDDETTSTVASLLAQELDHRVTSLPQLYNGVDRRLICSFSHEPDYEGEGLEAERKASLLTARRLGQDCVLLGHVTGKPELVTVEVELHDAGTGNAIGEPWTLTGTAEELCACDGEMLLEALGRANIELEPAQRQWLEQPLSTNEDAFRLALEYLSVAEGSESLRQARALAEAAPDYPLVYSYLLGAEQVYGSCLAAGKVIRDATAGDNVQPRMLLSGLVVASRCGEWSWAEEMIARHQAAQPKSFLRTQRAMSHYLVRHKQDDAAPYAEQLLELNPRSAYAWWYVGRVASSRAHVARAGKYTIHMTQAEGAVFSRELGRAAAALPQAAAMDPLHSGVLMELLDVFHETAGARQTEALFEYYRELYPTDPSPYRVMLWVYKPGYEDRPDKLEALRHEIAEFEAETPGQRFAVGGLLYTSDSNVGLRLMRQAIEEADSAYWPSAHASLARKLGSHDRTAVEGEKHARIALRQCYSQGAHRGLVVALSNQDKYAEAIKEAVSLVQRYPGDEDVHWIQGQVLFAAKKYVEAAQAFERAHAIERRHISAARECARSWLVIGRIEEAKKKLYEMEQDSLYSEHIKSMDWANYFLAAGEYEHALEWYERAIKKNPGNAALKMNRGYCYLCMGDYKQAREIWEQYSAQFSNDPEYVLGIALCDLMAGDKASAVKRYRKAKAKDPEFCTEENLRYRYWAPRCIELLGVIERLSAQETDQSSAE